MENDNKEENIKENDTENSVEKRESESQLETAKTIKLEETLNLEITNKSLMDILLKNESKKYLNKIRG